MDVLFTYSFSKDKLPKTLSYPLKRSLLDAALDAAFVAKEVHSVRYLLRHRSGDSVLDAIYSPDGTGAYASGRSLITLYSVPSDQRNGVEAILTVEALPILCSWLARAAREGNVWRWAAHRHSLQDSRWTTNSRRGLKGSRLPHARCSSNSIANSSHSATTAAWSARNFSKSAASFCACSAVV